MGDRWLDLTRLAAAVLSRPWVSSSMTQNSSCGHGIVPSCYFLLCVCECEPVREVASGMTMLLRLCGLHICTSSTRVPGGQSFVGNGPLRLALCPPAEAVCAAFMHALTHPCTSPCLHPIPLPLYNALCAQTGGSNEPPGACCCSAEPGWTCPCSQLPASPGCEGHSMPGHCCW